MIGAVNTIVRRGDRWVGENTDGRGFVELLRAVADPAGNGSPSAKRPLPVPPLLHRLQYAAERTFDVQSFQPKLQRAGV